MSSLFAYFSYNGSEPLAVYLLKRPPSRGRYALGLLDAQCPSLVYAEVLVEPEWSQPTTTETRSSPVPLVPDAFSLELFNPHLAVAVKLRPASWNKSDAWEFEVPETSFKLPSASRIDQDDDNKPPVAALAPRVCFRWKRDGRLTKDLTCYMCGRSVAGTKSKEPDITVAMFRAAKNQGAVTIYEPNLARVDVEDRKGLELILLLGAVAIRDLYLAHRSDPFNLASSSSSSAAASSGPQPVLASGALACHPPVTRPTPQHAAQPPLAPPRQQQPPPPNSDAETRRLRAMMAQEERERQRRDQEEQMRIQRMLADEEASERRRREAEVERETERLRRQYGVPPPPQQQPPPNRGWWQGPAQTPPPPPPPARPNSVGDRRKYSGRLNMLLHGPYAQPGSNGSGFFHRGGDDRRGRMLKKRSVHF
ncbi:hypothetical protein L249_1599 [Ophiocordyceps polyrhachis-furcata BCC 54312]|uniref:Uncharacterized protein n=1 Tax=Ophiocordyceps polyrhachis-furcata BCC 54312 TaxID=1330021 RepID=A0A367KZM3_9HYPO|nr:hypothetical protein L249_1599 [Ophiocordyceps polyrhachis-furcata BCC 54312]